MTIHKNSNSLQPLYLVKVKQLNNQKNWGVHQQRWWHHLEFGRGIARNIRQVVTLW